VVSCGLLWSPVVSCACRYGQAERTDETLFDRIGRSAGRTSVLVDRGAKRCLKHSSTAAKLVPCNTDQQVADAVVAAAAANTSFVTARITDMLVKLDGSGGASGANGNGEASAHVVATNAHIAAMLACYQTAGSLVFVVSGPRPDAVFEQHRKKVCR
jgi:hypothetical protein